MVGNNKARENMTSSSYGVVSDKSFNLDITMNGDDEFTQTIIYNDGTKEIETYQRLKK